MVSKTFSRHLPFVAFLTLWPASLWGENASNRSTEQKARVTVSVFSEAAVPRSVLGRAEQAASQIFLKAGIEVTWLDCQVPPASERASRDCRECVFPTHLHLRIVRKSTGLTGDAMGVSFLGEGGIGCRADLFYEPMQRLATSDRSNLATLLGHVAAHEIGHLLLGTNSHAVAGIMQARWKGSDLTGAASARMVFLDQESDRMKERLLERR